MDPLDLTSLLPQPTTNLAGAQLPAATPQKGPWGQWIDDPINRAGLLSFGLQAMTGGFGDQKQQLAAALGSGFAGAQGQAQAQADVLTSEDEAEAKANDQATRIKVAEIGADARVTAAETRGANALARAQIVSAAKSPEEQKAADTLYNRLFSQEKSIQWMTKKTDQQIEAEARTASENAVVAGRARRTLGPGPGGAEISSGNSVPGSVPGGPAVAAKPGATTPSDTAQRWEQALKIPGFKEKLQTVEGRDELEAKFPGLKPFIAQHVPTSADYYGR